MDMCVMLGEASVWEVVNGSVLQPNDNTYAICVWAQKSALGFVAIYLGLANSEKTHINSLVGLVDRGSQAWFTLSHCHATNSTITHVNIKKCMFNTCHIPDTPISHYYSEIIACANKLQGIGVQVSPHEVQDLIIANLPTGEWTTYGASILMCPGSLLVQDLTQLLDDFKQSQGQIGQQDAVQGALTVTSGGDSQGGQGRGRG